MEAPRIPPNVSTLLAERIESSEQLEVLLLLHEHRDHPWSPDAITRELGTARDVIEEALEHLRAERLLTARFDQNIEVFEYSPGSADLEAAVDGLARVYADYRVEILRVLAAHSFDRLRAAMRSFADALLTFKKSDDE